MEIRHLFLRELHDAFDAGIERVVLSAKDTGAWMNFRTALADNDLSGKCVLSIGDFHAQTLTSRVTSELGRTTCFFMCHRGALKRPSAALRDPAIASQ